MYMELNFTVITAVVQFNDPGSLDTCPNVAKKITRLARIADRTLKISVTFSTKSVQIMHSADRCKQRGAFSVEKVTESSDSLSDPLKFTYSKFLLPTVTGTLSGTQQSTRRLAGRESYMINGA